MNYHSPQIENLSDFVFLLERAEIKLDILSLMDILWLGGKIEQLRDGASNEKAEDVEETIQAPIITPNVDNEEEEIAWSESIPDVEAPSEETKLDLLGQTKPRIEGEGIPLKVPAAPSLRSKRLLSKALRPLMRKVPSPTRRVFDEEATVTQISEQKIWAIVEAPEPERWLDLAIVVEDGPSAFLWRDTIEELQLLAERQGAFRQIHLWQLHSSAIGGIFLKPGGYQGTEAQSRSPKVLLNPSNRQIIWILSDYTSKLWRNIKIYEWLHEWGHRMPVALIQFLPERLWNKSILGEGWPIKLSALTPGVPNTKLEVESLFPVFEPDFLDSDGSGNLTQDKQAQPASSLINIPVVTLEPEPLNRLAKVIAGVGDEQISGVQLDPNHLSRVDSTDQSYSDLTKEESEDLVRHFQVTASIPAQKLAGMMAAVPISLPIVNLIRQTMLPSSRQVHVAEVYMSGLLHPTHTSEESDLEQWDFVSDEVRDILIGTIFKSRTEAVLDAVSAHISKRLGLASRSFEALIANLDQLDPDQQSVVLPFAKIATQTLKRLGGYYAKIADQIAPSFITPEPPVQDNYFPPIEILDFTSIQLIGKEDFGTPVKLKSKTIIVATVELEPIENNNSESP